MGAWRGGRFSGLRFLSVHSLDNTVLLNSSITLGQFTGECETAGMKISSSQTSYARTGPFRRGLVPQVEEFRHPGILFTREI